MWLVCENTAVWWLCREVVALDHHCLANESSSMHTCIMSVETSFFWTPNLIDERCWCKFLHGHTSNVQSSFLGFIITRLVLI